MVTRISDWDRVEGDLVWENKGSQAMNNEWIVMPNHLHGILLIVEHSSNGVGAYKSTMARLINGLRRTPGAPFGSAMITNTSSETKANGMPSVSTSVIIHPNGKVTNLTIRDLGRSLLISLDSARRLRYPIHICIG